MDLSVLEVISCRPVLYHHCIASMFSITIALLSRS